MISNILDKDTLITKANYGDYGLQYSTSSYTRDEKIFYEKENRGEISFAMKYKIELSQQTSDMIERDGGMSNILKNCLTKENYNELRGELTFIIVNMTMSLDGSKVTGYSFSISNRNINNIHLSPQEIEKLFNYFKQITLVYTGKEFRDEIAPVGWGFPAIRLKKE